MSVSKGTNAALSIASFMISLAAMIAATYSFMNDRPSWGGYNLAISAVGLLTFLVIRSRHDV